MNKSKRVLRQRYRLSTYLSFLRMGYNGILHLLARVVWGGRNLRPFLHRLRGAKISKGVFIGDDVYLDEDFPEAIEIHEGVVIGPRCTIIAHTRGAGKIIIEKDAAIAAGCVIVCGPGQTLTIGEGSVLSAGSTVSHSIPRFTLCGAPRLKAYGRVSVPFTFDSTYEDFKRGLQPIRPGDREPS